MLREKYKLVLLILLFLFIFLVGCKKDIQDLDQSENNSINISSENLQGSVEDEVNQNDAYSWDLDKLRLALGIKDEMEVLFLHYNDFDSDNSEELIIAFGHDYEEEKDYIEDIYYIENVNGEYEMLSHIQSSGYSFYDVELINLVDIELPVLYCRNTNYANLIGFEIYEIKDNALKQLVYSASATGVGHDEMTDLTKDGVYTGYIQRRKSYDALYTNLVRYYSYVNDVFELENISADFYNYPATPEEVVLEYLNMHSLKQLEEIEIPDIEVRLRKLCPRNFEPPILYDYDVMVEYNMLLEGALEFNTTYYDDNMAEVYVTYRGNLNNTEVVYSMGQFEDKWIIFDSRDLSKDYIELSKRINEFFESYLVHIESSKQQILQKYKDVLISQISFVFKYVVAEGEKSYFLDDIAYDGYWMKPIRFSLVDMDGDLTPELIVECSLGAAGFVLVIREFEDEMIAHEFSHRQMYDLKKDGTFGASGGAAYSGYFELEFDNSTYYINRIAETDTDGNLIPIFYIGETLTEEDEFWEFWESLRNKEEAEWFYFDLNDDMES